MLRIGSLTAGLLGSSFSGLSLFQMADFAECKMNQRFNKDRSKPFKIFQVPFLDLTFGNRSLTHQYHQCIILGTMCSSKIGQKPRARQLPQLLEGHLAP